MKVGAAVGFGAATDLYRSQVKSARKASAAYVERGEKILMPPVSTPAHRVEEREPPAPTDTAGTRVNVYA